MRNQHQVGDLTRHHEIVVVTSPGPGLEKGTAFHMSGSPGLWQFAVSHGLQYMNMSYCGRLRLGTIPGTADALKGLETFLRTVSIGNDDPNFDCHRWVWNAAVRMRDYGYQANPPATFQGYLALIHTEAYPRWDNAQD